MKVAYKNNQVHYEIDANGEILSQEEKDKLLIAGKNQFAETRIYETFLEFRTEGRCWCTRLY